VYRPVLSAAGELSSETAASAGVGSPEASLRQHLGRKGPELPQVFATSSFLVFSRADGNVLGYTYATLMATMSLAQSAMDKWRSRRASRQTGRQAGRQKD
jgi:hypothetical protein